MHHSDYLIKCLWGRSLYVKSKSTVSQCVSKSVSDKVTYKSSFVSLFEKHKNHVEQVYSPSCVNRKADGSMCGFDAFILDNFRQYTTFINRKLSSIDNLNQ